MAVPGQATGVLVESRTQSSTNLTWTLADQTDTGVKIKRSTDNITFSTISTTAAHATTFEDDTVTAATRYWYKVAPTNGSGDATDSATVNVVVQSQPCTVGSDNPDAVALPRAGQTVDAATFNDAMTTIESSQNQSSFADQPCTECITNGAVVLDCQKCTNFQVSVTADINSISMPNCDNVPDGNIDLNIPAGSTVHIGGFPSNLGFDGFEGLLALTGGSGGKTYSVGFGKGSAKSAAGRGTPAGVPLALNCSTTNCSVNCATTKTLTVTAVGGSPPYTFSVTGSVNIAAGSTSAVLTPPTNSGSGVAGTAYSYSKRYNQANGGVSCQDNYREESFKCDDTSAGCNAAACDGATVTCNNGNFVRCADLTCDTSCSAQASCAPGSTSCGTGGACTNGCTQLSANGGRLCDKRTGTMISSNCVPCGISTSGQVVTVRDSRNVSVSRTITL